MTQSTLALAWQLNKDINRMKDNIERIRRMDSKHAHRLATQTENVIIPSSVQSALKNTLINELTTLKIDLEKQLKDL